VLLFKLVLRIMRDAAFQDAANHAATRTTVRTTVALTVSLSKKVGKGRANGRKGTGNCSLLSDKMKGACFQLRRKARYAVLSFTDSGVMEARERETYSRCDATKTHDQSHAAQHIEYYYKHNLLSLSSIIEGFSRCDETKTINHMLHSKYSTLLAITLSADSIIYSRASQGPI
jgi:hypothetical protein